jgi:signal transduction histidine kinase
MKELSGDYLTLFLAGIFGMILLSVALVVFFVMYQRRILEEERKRVEKEKAHQMALLSAAVDVQETERRRIASDLHDDIGSLLSATRLYLQQLCIDASAEKTESIKKESLNILDEMIQNTRRITHDLLPPVLEKFGFQAAAEDLCERIEKTGSINVTFSSNIEQRLAPKQEIALYRVLQELINNTLKHAGAKNITVTVHWARDLFAFAYQDDGKGFDPASQVAKGLGLRNIESRISLIHGNLESISKSGEGLRVDITLPT